MSHHGRDYIERTIATVRNHRDADNCWPQWANIFADEIETSWRRLDELKAALRRIERNPGAARRIAQAALTSSEGGGNREHLSSAKAAAAPDPEATP